MYFILILTLFILFYFIPIVPFINFDHVPRCYCHPILNSVIIILQRTTAVWYVILFYYLLVILFSYLIVLAVVPFLFSLTRLNFCNLGIFHYHILLPSPWSPLPPLSSLTRFHHQYCVALLTEYIASLSEVLPNPPVP